MTFDHYDGLHSALIGLLNGGVSGFTMGHSDIGGYTSVKLPKPSPLQYIRTRELLYRWIEMSTFSDCIMRSHPSNLPLEDFQIYSDDNAVDFMAKFTKIHVRLEAYKRSLMVEASTKGTPFTRPLLLAFPDCASCRAVNDQFMLGTKILVAPIVKKGSSDRKVLLPPGVWTHAFTKKEYKVDSPEGQLIDFKAPQGQPLVFTTGEDSM